MSHQSPYVCLIYNTLRCLLFGSGRYGGIEVDARRRRHEGIACVTCSEHSTRFCPETAESAIDGESVWLLSDRHVGWWTELESTRQGQSSTSIFKVTSDQFDH